MIITEWLLKQMAKYFIKITKYIMFISQGNEPVVNTVTDKIIRTESTLSGPQTHCKDRIYLNIQ